MKRLGITMAALALTVVTGMASENGPAQAGPQATFRTGVDLIQLDVSVLDRNRDPVRGLTAADFTILENGVPRPVAAFTAVDLPDVVTTGADWQRSVEPDVVSNRFDAQRVVVILLDDFSVPFDPGVTKIARTIGRAVVDRLGPADLGAVVFTVGRNKGQELTTDRARLSAAVDRFVPTGFANARPSSPFSASTRRGAGPVMPPTASGACMRKDCITQALRKVAEALEAKPGARKTLVFISPSIELPREDLEDSSLMHDLRLAIAAMQQANLNVYQFDPRGLEVASNLDENFDFFSASTGGRAVHNTNTPWEAVPRIFRENSSYYLLGFRTTARQDGRFHKVTVKVARPDVEVRSRSGYFAATPDRKAKPSNRAEPTALERAIAGALPTGDLPVSVTAAPFAVSGGKEAALIVSAGIDRAAGEPPSQLVEVSAVAFDENWKPARALTQTTELTRKDHGSGEIHFDIGSRLDLRPGRYELRLAVRAQGDDRAGSVYTSVTIPDFAKAPLSLSGVVLEREPAQAAVPSVKAILPVLPTTIREFARGDAVSGFFRIYQGGRQPLKPTRVTLRLVDERDRTILDETTTAEPSSFGTTRTLDRRFRVPLSHLQPGAYLLSIAAVHADRPAVERAVTFRVR